jgi:hypothetical protein
MNETADVVYKPNLSGGFEILPDHELKQKRNYDRRPMTKFG